MQLAPDLAEAHEALGVIRRIFDLDWKGAQASFARALELAPGNVRVICNAVRMLYAWGRPDEAIALMRQAAELDPLSGAVYRLLAQSYLYAGRLDEAHAAILKSIELSPRVGFVNWRQCEICLRQDRLDEALDAAKREIHDWLRLLALAMVYHAQGRHAESDAALGELIDTQPDSAAYQVAEAFAYRDERDQAFAWLERAYAQRDPGIALLRSSLRKV